MGLTPAQTTKMFDFLTALSKNSFSNLLKADLHGSANFDSNQTLGAYARFLEYSTSLNEFRIGEVAGKNPENKAVINADGSDSLSAN